MLKQMHSQTSLASTDYIYARRNPPVHFFAFDAAWKIAKRR
jgi:hypothetical protein